MRDREFAALKKILEGVAVELRRNGKGKLANRSRSLSLEDEEILWTHGEFGKNTPRALSHTFDTVPHSRLLDLLTHYGINEPIFSWISVFLSNRKQQVSINGCLSSTFCVTSGVPQGSVLGPLLFIIFINSLVEKATTDNMYLYAHDLKVFNEICSDEDVDKLQYGIDKLLHSKQHQHEKQDTSLHLTNEELTPYEWRANIESGVKGHPCLLPELLL